MPAFFPDATHGFVKGVGAKDLIDCHTKGIVINTYHFIVDQTVDTVKKVGGIENFTKFPGVIISDSGGFQAMSLIRRNPQNGKINDNGVIFKIPGSGKIITLTPELCVKTQLELDSNIVMCLDDCTDPDESLEEQKISVTRTIQWAKRCKDTFDKFSKYAAVKQLIFGIIQGGSSRKLRKYCAEELIKIGFDGYAFGGFPVDKKNKFLSSILKYTADLMPNDKPKYAMGVGKPENIKEGVKMGYNLFDCVLPTRDARHQRLYVNKGKTYGYIYIGAGRYKADQKPISRNCECETCKQYSRAYLYNLFKNHDSLSFRLATIHNLFFYNDYVSKLK